MTEATRNLLEHHFDTDFAAPDGIAKLRELILTLAMQGKLVEQDPNDTSASDLLKEIEDEKQRLHSSSSPRRRGTSKPKPLPSTKAEEVPYQKNRLRGEFHPPFLQAAGTSSPGGNQRRHPGAGAGDGGDSL